jgi:hypothetical protein
MKNRFLFATILFLSSFFTIPSRASGINSVITENLMRVANGSLQQMYEGLNLGDYGLNRNAMNYAIKGYQSLVNQGIVKNNQYLTIVDFSQSSRQKRFYVLDVVNQELVTNTYVLHGAKSGGEMAEKFSNAISSHQSSLGFYLTKYTYTGSRGYSLRLAGLEEGFNNNVEKRGVVVHGTKYVNDDRAQNGIVGRSQGCPAIPEDVYEDVIEMIKDGSVFFVYAPSQHYLTTSPVLNHPLNSLFDYSETLVPVI